MSGVKISALEIENLKRVKAVHLVPSTNGLTIVGGRNNQGKTSVLDAIAWAVGGAKFEPTDAHRDGAQGDPHITVTLSNGLTVERKGKSGMLRVFDPTGARSGQALLDSFVGQFAINLPKFMTANDREKAQILLGILGIGTQLASMDAEETAIYNKRHAIGQIADSKTKYADELPEFGDAPQEPVSVSELIQRQQVILATNGENQRKRTQYEQLTRAKETAENMCASLRRQLAEVEGNLATITADLEIATQSAQSLRDESTADLERDLANIEAINSQVAANQQKAAAIDEAATYRSQYDELTVALDKIRFDRLALLNGAALPLPGLSVTDGALTYQGKRWDCMSSSEQLRVAVAIVRKLSPSCGFVLLDKLEQMDLDTLAEFGAWAASEGLQIIATRVSTGAECSIIIEDGLPQGETYADVVTGVSATQTEEW